VNSAFLPHVLTAILVIIQDKQRAQVVDIIREKLYIPIKELRSLHITKPIDFVRVSFPEAIELSSCIVLPALLNELELALSALQSDGGSIRSQSDTNWYDLNAGPGSSSHI